MRLAFPLLVADALAHPLEGAQAPTLVQLLHVDEAGPGCGLGGVDGRGANIRKRDPAELAQDGAGVGIAR